MEDAVAWRRVIRPLDPMLARELATDPGLLVVVRLAGEDEMIVGDRRLPRIDGAAAGDLIERVNRKRRGAVGRRQQIGVDAERRARPDVRVLVHPVRPDDLLRSRHAARHIGRRKDHLRLALDRRSEFAAADREDAAALADLVLLGRQRNRRVAPVLRDVRDLARGRVERELIAVTRIGDRLGALDDVQAEVEGVAAEDVAHVPAADDHHLAADFLGDGLQSRRRHLARGADREPIAGNDERLAGVHPRAEVRHQIAERSGLPALVERLEALGHTVSRRSDLIGVDGVELPAGLARIPENQRGPSHEPRAALNEIGRPRLGQGVHRYAGLQYGTGRGLHSLWIIARRVGQGGAGRAGTDRSGRRRFKVQSATFSRERAG